MAPPPALLARLDHAGSGPTRSPSPASGERLDDGDRARYAALLSLGLREAVGQRYRRDWYRHAWRTIGPASPAEACDPR